MRERLDYQRTRCLIRLSVAILGGLGLDRSAENVTLLYAYFDRRDRALCAALDRALVEHGALTQDHCDALYARFVALDPPADRGGRRTGEVGTLVRRLDGLEERYGQVVEDLAQRLVRAEHLATTDGLTGLLNRRSFEERARVLVDEAHRDARPLSRLMLDVDHFKSFNDRFGHDVGDHVLRLIAHGLEAYPGGATLAARHGGEEFALLLPGIRRGDTARVADTIREALSRRRLIMRGSNKPLDRITVSIGVAELAPGETPEQLVRRADKALYHAKSQGRNRVVVASASAVAAMPSRRV